MVEQVGAKKKRVRAGHRASASRLIAQVESTDESPELNAPMMNRIVQTLKEKLDIIRKLDEEILEAISEEEEIKDEIEQADIYREKIDMAIISMQIRIAELERAETLSLRSHETRQQEPSTQASQQRADARDEVRAPSQEDHERTPSPEPARSITGAPSVRSTPVPESGRGPRVKLPKVVLKRFDGRPTEWATFWDMFQSSVHNNPDLSDIDRFNYLHSLLDGLAANSISGLSLTSVNYAEAIAVLQKRFGNKQQVINKHMDALLELEAFHQRGT